MPLWIARKPKRIALTLPLGGTRELPTTIIPLYKMEKSELDELVEAVLEKRKIKPRKHEIIEKAEEGYEYRIKVAEASRELRMRIAEQAAFPKLRYGGLKPPRKRSGH